MTENIKEVPFGTKVPGKKNGAFVTLTAMAQLYLDYEDPGMTKEYKETYYPVVLMVNRWDGRVGFPGGFVDGDESLLEAAKRELIEEAGLSGNRDFQLRELCSHEAERIIVHAYHCDLGKVTKESLVDILRRALNAEHVVAEGTLAWMHLADYGRGKGRTNLLNNNMLALAVKEELEAVLAVL